MRTGRVFVLILGLLSLLAGPAFATAAETHTLEFIPTQNAPAGARGTMDIKVVNGKTIAHFSVRGASPNTVYTIWTVFNLLVCAACGDGIEVPAKSASTRLGFPLEGNGVSPLARLDDGFTNGMGMDPGASFFTNGKGDGEVQVKLDYDLISQAPVSNRDVIVQCAPTPAICEKKVKVTTTWLRKFIGEFALSDRATMCANYDPRFDSEVVPNPVARLGMDARLWQCIEPATVDPHTGSGLPRVWRFEFDHFRLANHPDDLTHGFIGGNATDHRIDMVGRRCDLVPAAGPPCF